MQRKVSNADKESGERKMPSYNALSLSSMAALIGFSDEELKELNRLYGHLENKNAN